MFEFGSETSGSKFDTIVIERLSAMNTLKRLWNEEEAATATEYAIIAAILGVSLVGIFIAFRQQIAGFFQNLGTQVQGNTNINP